MTWHAWSGCTKPPKTGLGSVQRSGVRAVVPMPWLNFHEGMCAARQPPLTHIPYEFLYAGTSYKHTCRHRVSLHIASQMLLGMVDRCHIEPELFDL